MVWRSQDLRQSRQIVKSTSIASQDIKSEIILSIAAGIRPQQETVGTMTSHARRLAVLLPLLLAACGLSGQQRTTQHLNDRLAEGTAPDVAAGNMVLQPLPDGAQVTLLGSSLFPADERALSDQTRDVRTGVIQSLLDPRLMRVHVVDTSGLPAEQRDARVRNITQYFIAYGLESTLVSAAPQAVLPPGPVGATPLGLTITISVQCPHPRDQAGYGDDTANPVCD
jgi:hypothetical protein